MPRLPAEGGGARRERGRDVTDQWDVRAVLLDMDGTLLDTERVYFDSLVTALHCVSATPTTSKPLCHAMVGLPGPDCEAMLHRTLWRKLSARRDQQGFPRHSAIEISPLACR